MAGSPKPGALRKTLPRAKPGWPTIVPFGATTINCSTQEWAELSWRRASSPRRTPLEEILENISMFGKVGDVRIVSGIFGLRK